MQNKHYVLASKKRTYSIREINEVARQDGSFLEPKQITDSHLTDPDFNSTFTYRQFDQRLYIRNRTSKPISIGTRAGLKFTILPSPIINGTIEIGYDVNCGVSVKDVQPEGYFDQRSLYEEALYDNYSISGELNEFYQDVKDKKSDKKYISESTRDFIFFPTNDKMSNYAVYHRKPIMRYLTEKDLYRAQDHQMYVSDLDLTVGLCTAGELKHHPFSPSVLEQRSKEGFEINSTLGSKVAATHMVAVDPSNSDNQYFAVFPTGVQKVPVVEHLEGKEPGVYVFVSQNQNFEPVSAGQVKYFTFEDAEKQLMIFRSKIDLIKIVVILLLHGKLRKNN